MGTYKKVRRKGKTMYKGDTRTVSLKQIKARYYFKKHPSRKGKK